MEHMRQAMYHDGSEQSVPYRKGLITDEDVEDMIMVLGTNVLSIKHCNVACKHVASVHSDCFGSVIPDSKKI